MAFDLFCTEGNVFAAHIQHILRKTTQAFYILKDRHLMHTFPNYGAAFHRQYFQMTIEMLRTLLGDANPSHPKKAH